MSFNTDIKNELVNLRPSYCCKQSLIYGFLLFSRSFSIKKIVMQTENEQTANLYKSLLFEVYGADVTVKKGGGKRTTYVASVVSEADRLKILASVDFGIFEGKINSESFIKECCAKSFVRGAFLACGHITDPDKDYRVDFPIKEKKLAEEFCGLLKEYYIDAHISKRQSGYLLYIKRNEMIVNLLALIGASARSLQLIETSIIKSVKNNTNRALNCDSANINKTVEASIKQRKAIEYLKENDIFLSLPEELIEAANLRTQYPEISLKELSKKSSEPISVSGLSHRFKRITDIAEEIKKRKS